MQRYIDELQLLHAIQLAVVAEESYGLPPDDFGGSFEAWGEVTAVPWHGRTET